MAAIQDRDAIFLSAVGTSAATFVKEARERGYNGLMVGATISILGVWKMVTSLTNPAQLDGLLVPHFYPLFTDDSAYSDQLNQMIEKYRSSEAASLKKGTTWMSGWMTGQVLVDTIRLAAGKVGAENVDGSAINDAFKELNIEIPGMPNITLANSGTHHVLLPYCRMIEYNAAEDDWFAATDWFIAPGFVS